jgi:serine/threonine protein kinase
MEFHPHTLKDFIRKPNRSVEETLEVCYQLSEATMQMHQSGVIHRDLKP